MIRQQNMIVLFCLFKLLLGTGWGKRMVTLFDCFRMTRHNSWRVVPVYLNPIFPFFNTIKLILIYNENSFHDSFIRYYYNRCPVVVLINHVVYESFWGFLIINKRLRLRLRKRNRFVDNSIKTYFRCSRRKLKKRCKNVLVEMSEYSPFWFYLFIFFVHWKSIDNG